MAPSTCAFLEIPVELRLLIYSHALLESPAITISTAEIVGAYPDIIHRLYGAKRSPYPGIPEKHEPVVEATYTSGLLSATNPETIHAGDNQNDLRAGDEGHEYEHTPGLNLRLVNKQVHEELSRHFRAERNRNTSLFVQYPHGLHVFCSLTPHLLQQARSVHLAGTYVSRSYCPARAACMGPRQGHPSLDQRYYGDLIPDAAAQLTGLIKGLFGPEAKHQIQKLEMRIYYPGDDSYSTVWGDDSSPIVIALRSINIGEIGIEVWRGRYATGVYLTAKPASDRRRIVSTVWRRLEEGRRGEPRCGSWIVDPKWPRWEEEYEMSAGPKGDLMVETPVTPPQASAGAALHSSPSTLSEASP